MNPSPEGMKAANAIRTGSFRTVAEQWSVLVVGVEA